MRLYDTARRAVVPFEPGPVVRMYVCGITPYDSTHLGHASTYLAYDLLVRRLEDLGHSVQMVRNITDVDDSILPKARSLGVDFLELAASETARFHDDMAALGVRAVHAEPRATRWVAEMVTFIERLETLGHAYVSDGAVFFDVTTFEGFGELSGCDEATMVSLAAERGGNPDDPRRRNPLDFVLWQPSAHGEPSWPSPWGDGRPGWHIECSAMAMGTLGETIDLHGGGSDLIFPHHECERAQSEAANGAPFARHWMHCGMVAYAGAKMSKSLGNLVFVSELCKIADPRAIRLALMAHHYRSDWEWHDDEIDASAADLERLWTARHAGLDGGAMQAQGNSSVAGEAASSSAGWAERVRAALDDDLDAPAARAELMAFAGMITAGGSDPGAPALLGEVSALCGIDLDAPIATLD